MNRNTAIVLAFVVICALTLGAICIPPILEEVFGEKPPVNTLVEFYDADGNLIDIPMAITAGGLEVESMIVKATWTVDAANIDPLTFNANIEVDIAVLSESGVYEQLGSKSIDSSVMVQTTWVVVHEWTLTTLLQEHMSDAHKDAGWTLRIRSTLTPTAKDLDGVDVIPDPPSQSGPTVTAILTWVDTTATMTIIAFEVNRWLPLAP